MPYKYILIVLAFYFISLIQNSFLSHFIVFGVTPNLLLALVCLNTFLDESQSCSGLVSAISAGAFLDILNGSFLGVSILAMLLVCLFIRKTLVYLIDFPIEYSILYFIPILAISSVLYMFIVNLLFCLFSWSIFLSFNIWAILGEVFLNVILGVIGFYSFRIISRTKHGF